MEYWSGWVSSRWTCSTDHLSSSGTASRSIIDNHQQVHCIEISSHRLYTTKDRQHSLLHGCGADPTTADPFITISIRCWQWGGGGGGDCGLTDWARWTVPLSYDSCRTSNRWMMSHASSCLHPADSGVMAAPARTEWRRVRALLGIVRSPLRQVIGNSEAALTDEHRMIWWDPAHISEL